MLQESKMIQNVLLPIVQFEGFEVKTVISHLEHQMKTVTVVCKL